MRLPTFEEPISEAEVQETLRILGDNMKGKMSQKSEALRILRRLIDGARDHLKEVERKLTKAELAIATLEMEGIEAHELAGQVAVVGPEVDASECDWRGIPDSKKREFLAERKRLIKRANKSIAKQIKGK